MKIQIIGLGVVGTAQAFLSQRLNHEVFGFDIAKREHPYCHVTGDYIKDADITFICTLEDTVEGIIKKIKEEGIKGVIAIKSTTIPGTTKTLMEKYNVHLCHNPEFLRQKSALEDIINPNMIIIGQCCPEHGAILKSFYEPLNKPVMLVNSTTSEMVKITLNTYLATLISFWNEINELCSALNLNTKTIANMAKYDPRISNYGADFFGEPFDGRCLPKDLKHIIHSFEKNNLNPKLFKACEEINQKVKRNKIKYIIKCSGT